MSDPLATCDSPDVAGKRKNRGCEDTADHPPAPVRAKATTFVAAASTSIGSRQTQEDRFALIQDGWADVDAPGVQSWPACRFFGVFDGHSGQGTAELVSTLLWAELKAKLITLLSAAPQTTPSSEELEGAMLSAFAAVDARAVETTGGSGSTATVALTLGDALVIANLGDSRTVLCRSERCFFWTEDHKPSNPLERRRIEAAGGFVNTPHAAGEWNVPRLNGILSVARAFGDAALKVPRSKEYETAPLSAVPDLTHRTLGKFDEFLLLASDGLWDIMDSHQAVEIARGVLKKRRAAPGEPQLSIEDRAQKAADRLVAAAVHSGHCMDNVTVLLAMLADEC